eukprot:5647775-Amphidinium_carterae.1
MDEMTRAMEARELTTCDEAHNQIDSDIQAQQNNYIKDETTSTTRSRSCRTTQAPQAANLEEGVRQPKAPPPGVYVTQSSSPSLQDRTAQDREQIRQEVDREAQQLLAAPPELPPPRRGRGACRLRKFQDQAARKG